MYDLSLFLWQTSAAWRQKTASAACFRFCTKESSVTVAQKALLLTGNGAELLTTMTKIRSGDGVSEGGFFQ